MAPSGALVDLTEMTAEIESVDGDQVPCECMLCDEPAGHDEMPVEWRLTWLFNRPPAVESGEGIMLLCDHCLHDWLENPDEFGGDPVAYHPV